MCLAGKSTRQTLPRQGEVFFMHCSSMLTKKKHFLIYLGQRPETDEVLLAAVITSQLGEQEKNCGRVSTANRRMIGSDAALLRRNAREVEARALAQKTGNKTIAKISFD